MKFTAGLLLLIAVFAPLALHAQSDDPAGANGSESSIQQELRDTLKQAFDQRLAEFKSGRSNAIDAIRLNTQLYEAQISTVSAEERLASTRQYVNRAKQIEQIANDSLKNGTGTSTDALEAKAARLEAMLELPEFQN